MICRWFSQLDTPKFARDFPCYIARRSPYNHRSAHVPKRYAAVATCSQWKWCTAKRPRIRRVSTAETLHFGKHSALASTADCIAWYRLAGGHKVHKMTPLSSPNTTWDHSTPNKTLAATTTNYHQSATFGGSPTASSVFTKPCQHKGSPKASPGRYGTSIALRENLQEIYIYILTYVCVYIYMYIGIVLLFCWHLCM